MKPGFFLEFQVKKGHNYDKIQSRVIKLVLINAIEMSDNYVKFQSLHYLGQLLWKSGLKQKKINQMLMPGRPMTYPNLITWVWKPG
jgi:hypothetical protein